MKDVLLFSMVVVGLVAASGGSLQLGDSAPDFILPDQDEKMQRLSDYRDGWVVVYFYPKDDTPGCTAEACGIRDDYGQFTEADITVFGISYDDPASHRAFKEKYELPFTLLSDSDKQVAGLYGAKGLLMPKRMTFVIDPEGVVRKIFNKVDVAGHSGEILAAVKQLRLTD